MREVTLTTTELRAIMETANWWGAGMQWGKEGTGL